jgi:hypothetical protein
MVKSTTRTPRKQPNFPTLTILTRSSRSRQRRIRISSRIPPKTGPCQSRRMPLSLIEETGPNRLVLGWRSIARQAMRTPTNSPRASSFPQSSFPPDPFVREVARLPRTRGVPLASPVPGGLLDEPKRPPYPKQQARDPRAFSVLFCGPIRKNRPAPHSRSLPLPSPTPTTAPIASPSPFVLLPSPFFLCVFAALRETRQNRPAPASFRKSLSHPSQPRAISRKIFRP